MVVGTGFYPDPCWPPALQCLRCLGHTARVSYGQTTLWVNAITHELLTVTNDTYITSIQVCDLLHHLAGRHLGLPLTLFLDNTRYQKCNLVMTTAAALQLALCFLPPYSPNLNLLERLWKFVKKSVCLLTFILISILSPPLFQPVSGNPNPPLIQS